MPLDPIEVKQKILATFRDVRANPKAKFDENHFFDYLLDPPAKRDAIKGSFKGTRKYYDFIRAIELEFGICFSFADQDKTYSVDKFQKKIIERIGKPKGNLKIITDRINHKDRYIPEIIFTAVFVFLYFSFKMSWLTFAFGIVYVGLMYYVITSRLRERRHERALYEKITQLAAEQADTNTQLPHE